MNTYSQILSNSPCIHHPTIRHFTDYLMTNFVKCTHERPLEMACSIAKHAFITLKLTVCCAAFVTTSVFCDDTLNSMDISLKYRHLKRVVCGRFDQWVPHFSNLAIYSLAPTYWNYHPIGPIGYSRTELSEVTDCGEAIQSYRWATLELARITNCAIATSKSISKTYLTYVNANQPKHSRKQSHGPLN
jgi:hypothetical protein